MIPSLNRPKYKPLIRLRVDKIDVWKSLKKKKLKKKKWRHIFAFFKRKQKTKRKNLSLINYDYKILSKFPVYRRYRYQKYLFIRKKIRIIYGRLQEYKIKQIATKGKNYGRLGLAKELEQQAQTFLHRFNFVKTYGKARLDYKHKRILINGSYKKIKFKKNDVLHFPLIIEKRCRSILSKNYLNCKSKISEFLEIIKKNSRKFSKNRNYKRKKILKKIKILKNKYKKYRRRFLINQSLDFDVNSLRFFVYNDIKYFKNHPFRLPFERVMRWYTRV